MRLACLHDDSPKAVQAFQELNSLYEFVPLNRRKLGPQAVVVFLVSSCTESRLPKSKRKRKVTPQNGKIKKINVKANFFAGGCLAFMGPNVNLARL